MSQENNGTYSLSCSVSQKFGKMASFEKILERNWAGITAYCTAEAKISPGCTEGLNNKVRVIQRRAYVWWGKEYLRPKVLTYRLSDIGNGHKLSTQSLDYILNYHS